MTAGVKYKHIPVLLKETIAGLNVRKDGFYIDGTFGRGGHSRAVLEQLSNKGNLLAIDRDEQALSSILPEFNNDLRFELIKEEMSENGKFPVKIQAGINYHSMNDMTGKLV